MLYKCIDWRETERSGVSRTFRTVLIDLSCTRRIPRAGLALFRRRGILAGSNLVSRVAAWQGPGVTFRQGAEQMRVNSNLRDCSSRGNRRRLFPLASSHSQGRSGEPDNALYIYIYFFSGVSFRLREARTAPDDRVIIVVPTRDEIPFTPYR